MSRELNENREFVRGVLESLRHRDVLTKTNVGKSTVYLIKDLQDKFNILNKDDKKIAFHFNTGAATEEEDEKLVLLVRGNFERNCSGYPASEQACEFVSKFKDDWKEYQGLLNKFFIQE